MTNEAPIVREQHGPVTVLTMVNKPYNLIGPTLMTALMAELRGAHKAGSRAIVIRSGLRHFSAGANFALFSSRLDDNGATDGAPGGRWSGIEFLKEAELRPPSREFRAKSPLRRRPWRAGGPAGSRLGSAGAAASW